MSNKIILKCPNCKLVNPPLRIYNFDMCKEFDWTGKKYEISECQEDGGVLILCKKCGQWIPSVSEGVLNYIRYELYQ